MIRRVAGNVFLALGRRDAGFGRSRLPHQLPPAVAVGLEVSPSVTPRERWDGWGSPRRRDARHLEAGGY